MTNNTTSVRDQVREQTSKSLDELRARLYNLENERDRIEDDIDDTLAGIHAQEATLRKLPVPMASLKKRPDQAPTEKITLGFMNNESEKAKDDKIVPAA